MRPGDRFQAVLEREMRRARAHRGALSFAKAGLATCLAAASLEAVALAWSLGPSSGIAWAWLLALPAAAAFGILQARRTPELEREVVSLLEDEAQTGSQTFASAAAVLAQPRASRLGPLVLAAADEAAHHVLPSAFPSHSALPYVRGALALAVLSGLMLLLPGFGAPRPGAGPTQPSPARAPGASSDRGGLSRGDQAEEDASELAELLLEPAKEVFLLGEELTLRLRLRAHAGMGEEVPLELILSVADGMPSPDQGLGIGYRILPLPLPWKLPAAGGPDQVADLPLKRRLENIGVYRAGLLTFEALARPRAGQGLEGGLRSNTVTVQIAENIERQRTTMPSAAAPKRVPNKPQPKPGQEKSQRTGGDGGPPAVGEPDRLPHVAYRKEVVKPLLQDGPLIEKEVEVFERERGGGERAPTPPPERLPDPPARIFERQPEEPMTPPAWTPADRRILGRYWEAVRRRG